MLHTYGFAAVLIPVVGSIIIALGPRKKDRIRNVIAVIFSLLTAVVVFLLVRQVFITGETLYIPLIKILPQLELALRIDPLGGLFGGLASILWVFSMVYSTGYMAHEHRRKRYFTYYLLSLGVTMGIAFSANLFTLYLFYEFLTICTYPLVIHEGNKEAKEAGIKYMIYSFMGAGFVLFALLSTYALTGNLDFQQGGVFKEVSASSLQLQIIFIAFLLGFGVKAAIMPLHSWLPDAMAAPTPVSALLHAVAVVKAGIFGIIRAMYSIFGVDLLRELDLGLFVAILVSFTIILASITALRQDSLKKRLAYSTISQLGYITLGAGLLTPMGLSGGIIHILNHALLKITLFFCAGTIISVTGKKYISELGGVGKRMPLTMLAFTIASIGMVGILPVNGFISKWWLVEGSLAAGLPIFVVILISSAILNAAYFFPIITAAFFKEGEFKAPEGGEAPLSMVLPTTVLALTCIVFGIYLNLSVPVVEKVVAYLFL